MHIRGETHGKRRKYYIHPDIQFPYLRLIVASCAGIILFFIATSIYFTREFVLLISSLGKEYSLSVYSFINATKLLWIGYGILLIFVPALFGFIGLRESHKVAGSLYRLEGVVREMIKGNYPEHVTIRKKDKLHRMAGLLEKLSSNLRKFPKK